MLNLAPNDYALLASYQPEQGKVLQRNAYVSCPAVWPLSQWVDSFWQLQIPMGRFEFHAVPDNCVDWIIPLKHPEMNQLIRPFLSPKFFDLTGPAEVFGIRFRVLGHHWFFEVPIGELDTDSNGLDLGNPFGVEAVLTTVATASSFFKRCVQASAEILRQLRDTAADRRLQRFLQFSMAQVMNADGAHKPTRLPWNLLGISERQLRRLSRLYLGLSPKQFVRVLRFQQTLKVWQSPASINPAPAHLLPGYYDQPHFIREFKALAGVTPGQFSRMSVLYNKYGSP